MKPVPFQYQAPASIDDTLDILEKHGDDSKVLAGGQSLMPLLALRLAVPEVLVDITRLSELQEVSPTPEGCRYGAGVTHAAFEDARVHDATNGLLPTVAAGIGYRAIRNRGTLGGSLSHADASAEWPVVMSALGATLTARSHADGTREIPAGSFVESFFVNCLEDTELLTSVHVPRLAAHAHWGFYKACRKPGEFSDSMAVAIVSTDSGAVDGAVTGAEIWLGAAAEAPVRVTGLADALPGRALPEITKNDVHEAVAGALPPAGSDEDRYRVHLHGVSVWRALQQIHPDQEATDD